MPPYTLAFVDYFSGSANTHLSEKPEWVTIDGTTITLDKLPNETLTEWTNNPWECQLTLLVSAREGNVFEKGEKYSVSVDVNSVIALSGCVVKDSDDNGIFNVEGINYPAGEKKTVSHNFVYTGESKTSFNLLFAFGNCNKQRVVIENLKIEKLEDYDVTDLTLTASSLSASSGETVTLTAKDQYGFEVTDATFSFAEDDATGSSITGNTLTAGSTAGTAKVKATSGTVDSNTVEITISTEKDYDLHWGKGSSVKEGAAPNGYFSYFAEDGVELTDMLATETSATLTRSENKIGNNFWSTQIWYRVAEKSTLKFKVTSTVDGYITVANLSNKVINLEGNKASEEISVTLEAGANLSLQLGNVNGNSPLPAGTFTISDFSVTPAN